MPPKFLNAAHAATTPCTLTAAARAVNACAMSETDADIAALTFEEALRALEEIVRKLESGEVPLDATIDLYERGELLRKHCQARLDAAQARIERVVTGAGGEATGTQPFDA